MNLINLLKDEAILADLGDRLTSARLSRDLTQAKLAHDAGVSKRTVERIEAGHSTQLVSLIRILRALDLLGGLVALAPPPQPGPMELLRTLGKTPQRASGRLNRPDEPWTWADED